LNYGHTFCPAAWMPAANGASVGLTLEDRVITAPPPKQSRACWPAVVSCVPSAYVK